MTTLRFLPLAAALTLAAVLLPFTLAAGNAWAWAGYLIVATLAVVGLSDIFQTQHTILRNFPILGHVRYLLESVRPELRQYFFEDERDGRPFHREQRSLVYQRAKGETDYDPFGSELDVREVGYEWIGHSVSPMHLDGPPPRARIGGPHCRAPYEASLLNVSAMSFGSLGPNAVLALGIGAQQAGYAQNTGEGGVSRFHLESGADLIWQLGTGYFGARAEDGTFDKDAFEARAAHDSIRMIELKLSQGAKPGHGGILPGHKVTEEIAAARGVSVGEACLSPPGHSAFSTPEGLVAFVDRLRELSGGKPVGIKLCVGLPHEAAAIVKAMAEAGSGPDFIAVDGGEGGTGAAPPEFSDHVGMPLEEGLVLVRNLLVGAGVRDRVALLAAGKVTSAMDMLRLFALGADSTYSARAYMMSVGCIQAQLCHTNTCPAGVATQDAGLNRGLDPKNKGERAARFHDDTLATLMELTGALGLQDPREISPERVFRRVAVDESRTLAEIHRFVGPNAFALESFEGPLLDLWRRARADSWSPSA